MRHSKHLAVLIGILLVLLLLGVINYLYLTKTLDTPEELSESAIEVEVVSDTRSQMNARLQREAPALPAEEMQRSIERLQKNTSSTSIVESETVTIEFESELLDQN